MTKRIIYKNISKFIQRTKSGFDKVARYGFYVNGSELLILNSDNNADQNANK